MNVLEIGAINLCLGNRTILSDVYLRCQKGEIIGLLGKNGAGKSSVFKIAFGTLKAENQSIRLNNAAIKGNDNNIITYLPQFNFIPEQLSIKKIFVDFDINLEEFIGFFPLLAASKDEKFQTLSGGEKRLVEVYTIIKSKALFSILDEPFTNIAPIYIDTIKKILLIDKGQKGFIISDHNYRDVLAIADKIYLLSNQSTHLMKDLNELKKYNYVSRF